MPLELQESAEKQDDPDGNPDKIVPANARISKLKTLNSRRASDSAVEVDDTVETPLQSVQAEIGDTESSQSLDEEFIANETENWSNDDISEDSASQVAASEGKSDTSWLKAGLILLALGLIVASFTLDNNTLNITAPELVESENTTAPAPIAPSESVSAETPAAPGEPVSDAQQVDLAQAEVGESEQATRGLVNRNPNVRKEGELAREFIASVVTTNKSSAGALKQVYAEAEALRQAGARADAYLLFYFAARKGNGSAAMHLAEISNPIGFSTENGVIAQAAPFDAYRWYGVAKAAGIEEAEGKLTELKNWAETEAESGNEQAQRLLLQWR